jgi:hypothetical protein
MQRLPQRTVLVGSYCEVAGAEALQKKNTYRHREREGEITRCILSRHEKVTGFAMKKKKNKKRTGKWHIHCVTRPSYIYITKRLLRRLHGQAGGLTTHAGNRRRIEGGQRSVYAT